MQKYRNPIWISRLAPKSVKCRCFKILGSLRVQEHYAAIPEPIKLNFCTNNRLHIFLLFAKFQLDPTQYTEVMNVSWQRVRKCPAGGRNYSNPFSWKTDYTMRISVKSCITYLEISQVGQLLSRTTLTCWYSLSRIWRSSFFKSSWLGS